MRQLKTLLAQVCVNALEVHSTGYRHDTWKDQIHAGEGPKRYAWTV